jgi:signal transduction histidine kinase/CheY-like chemotaxis protein
MIQKLKGNIQIKVLIGYLLIFCAIIVSLLIAKQSYKQLLLSVDSLSKPDAEIARMNRVLTNLSEAETQIRIYSLTKKDQYLKRYSNNIKEIQDDLDSLRLFSQDSSVSALLIDSMNFFLNGRVKRLHRFVHLKRSKEKENLAQQAILKLSKVSDTTRTQIRTTTTTTTTLDTVVKAIEVKAKKKKGIFSWLSSKKEKTKIDSVETVIQRTEVKIDTSYISTADSLLEHFEKEIQLAQMREQLNRDIVSREELRLVEENSLIWEKIERLLSQLEKRRLDQLIGESEKAKLGANKAIRIIIIIVIVGLVLGVLFIIFTLLDISKSNYYRKELLIAKGKAEKLAKVKEEFLASMSHEIRTPLNAIIGFTKQLGKTKLQKTQNDFVKIVNNSSKHLLNLVNEILDLSKIEAGKLSIEHIAFLPRKVVEEVYELMQVSATSKQLDFQYSFTGEENIYLESDAFRIKQILLNLSSNAIKFTEKGNVKINAEVRKEKNNYLFSIEVRDTGIGIAEEKLEHIFENFSQADSFSARKYGGTGLGLAISRRLAKLLGGDLWVKSEEGKGSVFCLHLPLKESEQILETKKDLRWEQLPDALQGKKFLVAEDDEYSLLLVQTIFKNWKLNADFVNDGIDAWKLLQEKQYDLVLTDIHMPKMGGIQLCEKIRNSKDLENMPIVALTANVRESDIDSYLQKGMTSCLVKPFEESDLKSVLLDCIYGKDQAHLAEEADSTDLDKPYDLEQIKQFTADDTELILQIIEQFVKSAKINYKTLNEAYEQKEFSKVGETAHKMLSSFDQLKVNSVVPILKELENLLHKKESLATDENRVKELCEQLNKQIKLVIDSIQKEFKI